MKIFIGVLLFGLLKATLADDCRWCGSRCCDEDFQTCSDCDDLESGLSVGAIAGIVVACVIVLIVVVAACTSLCRYYGSSVNRKPVQPAATNNIPTVAYTSNSGSYPTAPPEYSENSDMPPLYSTSNPGQNACNPPPYNQFDMDTTYSQPVADNQLPQ
ncbi:uncharacterized protein LOC100179739 [Ciona intestinalis]